MHKGNDHSERQKAVDTGMASTLICLILGMLTRNHVWFGLATAILVVNMTAPTLFRPAAKVWFAFSHMLGSVMSKILLSIIFFTILTPLALLRRILGHDLMQLRSWKKSGSVFVVREHVYTAKEIEQPF
jgi:multisubunit Na+/H+ antiporter MnhG subunit